MSVPNQLYQWLLGRHFSALSLGFIAKNKTVAAEIKRTNKNQAKTE